MSVTFRGTTICAVKRNGHIAIAGDGQVTMGEHTIFKGNARKVRRIFGGQVAVGFAGSVADAFTLCEKFEEKLTQCGGNLERAAVAVAQSWRGDQAMRQLDSLLIVANKETMLIVSGNGEVIDPDEGIAAIGSGGNYRPGGCPGADAAILDLSARGNRGKGAAHCCVHLRVYQ